MLDAVILAVTVAVGAVLFLPRIARAELWRATITPLASIIGSGFLVLGPILNSRFGAWAPLAMLLLCAVAWSFGAAVRCNIAARNHATPTGPVALLESVSDWALAVCYIVSVAYYLGLFGAFGTRLAGAEDPEHARLLTSAAFVVILILGFRRGFGALERLEALSVTMKLAIIAGLLAGLAVFTVERATAGALVLNPVTLKPLETMTLLFGLVITVQGFEISRYLGDAYDPSVRIRSMKLAQGLASAIYLIYVLLLAYVFPAGSLALDETAIIDLMQIVAPVLPTLLVLAALAAQLSAAIADTGGAGGLAKELSGGRILARSAYAVLVAVGLWLTWAADVFEIVAYASRAFAIYYALQCAIAALNSTGWRRAGFVALSGLGIAIALFGTAVEG
ncbi:hypothetical protein [Litorisediminicola beolgyonensis]|uniref:APC family permease n=1 Tax=Litorisediminicola beolgyonensis TaxID=1173614 RepID=A0ABW3ZI49_9RHOB